MCWLMTYPETGAHSYLAQKRTYLYSSLPVAAGPQSGIDLDSLDEDDRFLGARGIAPS